MSPTPAVSVIMSAYNAEAFIGRAIASLQAQTFGDWELIVIDDCSSDDTQGVTEALAAQDARIRYLRADTNRGCAIARNAGLGEARGTWITILDADDQYTPDRLEFLYNEAQARRADIVADNQIYFDEALGRVVREKAYTLGGIDCLPLTAERITDNDAPPRLFSCGLLKPFIRRAFMTQSGVTIYDPAFRHAEDFGLLFTLLFKGARGFMFEKTGYIYTIPFGVKAPKEKQTSRTDYGKTGWLAIIEANGILMEMVRREAHGDVKLLAALQRRKRRCSREIVWREFRQHLREGHILQALKMARHANLLTYAWDAGRNKFRASGLMM
ncbi:MAG: glycosyltransferase family 2 protein [Alphaproteobacteria bacterium]|nr:glycosyltransferase family 2 protein [Alphaproteobacteria bacterium]